VELASASTRKCRLRGNGTLHGAFVGFMFGNSLMEASVSRVLLMMGVIIASPAAAQSGLQGGAAASSSQGVAGLSDPHTRLSTARDGSTCLINKRTHRKVCKSRAGWRKEAKALSAENS